MPAADPNQDPSGFVVVGGGISGLYATLLLARAGRRVRILERAGRVGGLAGSERFRGLPCDLGSHRLHPGALDQPLFREMASREPFLSRPRRGVLLFRGRRIPYPPTGGSILRALGVRRALSLGISLVGGRRRRALASWEGDREIGSDAGDVGFESFVRERVGDGAYSTFYAPYAEKVWGIPPSELSQTVAKKRISTAAPWALLRGLGGGGCDRFVYPSRGTSSIAAFLERALAAEGVAVETGHSFSASDAAAGEQVLYAGDIADLVPTRLQHRGVYLIWLALPRSRISEVETYYVPERRYWFGRVSELSNYSPELRRPGETVLCVEIPEGIWGPSIDFTAEPARGELLAQLGDAGIVPPGLRPLELRQRFVQSVYPLYRRGWMAEWRATMARIVALGNVLPFGRQALFLHCNLDHCADLAERAAKHAMAGRAVAGWLPTAERALALRVRD